MNNNNNDDNKMIVRVDFKQVRNTHFPTSARATEYMYFFRYPFTDGGFIICLLGFIPERAVIGLTRQQLYDLLDRHHVEYIRVTQ